MYRVGVDVGGTYTDLVAIDDAGRVTLSKEPSTPQDQSIGVMNGLGQVAKLLGLTLKSYCNRRNALSTGPQLQPMLC